MLKLISSVLALALYCSPVMAQPKYAVDDWCRKLSRSVGGGANVIAVCLRDEKEAEQKIRLMGYTPERIANWCDDVATRGTNTAGSYQVYLECVQDEFAGKGSAPE